LGQKTLLRWVLIKIRWTGCSFTLDKLTFIT
jgi:hypothetical protein